MAVAGTGLLAGFWSCSVTDVFRLHSVCINLRFLLHCSVRYVYTYILIPFVPFSQTMYWRVSSGSFSKHLCFGTTIGIHRAADGNGSTLSICCIWNNCRVA